MKPNSSNFNNNNSIRHQSTLKLPVDSQNLSQVMQSQAKIPPKPAVVAVFDPYKAIVSIFVSDLEGKLSLFHHEGGVWKQDLEFQKCILSKFSQSKSICDGEMSAVFEMNHSGPAIFFRSAESGYLNYAYKHGDKWVISDDKAFKEMKVAKSNPSSGNIISAVYEYQRNFSGVFFKGLDDLLHYYYFHPQEKRLFHDGDSFANWKVAGGITAVFEPQRKHSACFYAGEDQKMHYFYLSPQMIWAHDHGSFSQICGANGGGAELSSCFETNRQHSAVFFRASDGYLRYHFLGNPKLTDPNCPIDGPSWCEEFLSFKLGGRVKASHDASSTSNVVSPATLKLLSTPEGRVDFWRIGSISAEYAADFLKKSHSSVAFVGNDNSLHLFWIGKTGFWMHSEISDQKLNNQQDKNSNLSTSFGANAFSTAKVKLNLKNGKIAGPCGKISLVNDFQKKRIEIFYIGTDGLVYRVFYDETETLNVDNTICP